MATKSIPNQIFNEFIAKISKNTSISEELTESLKKLLDSGSAKKNDIVEMLKKEVQDNEDI